MRLNLLSTVEELDENADAIFYIYPIQLKATRRLSENFSVGAILKYNKMGFGLAGRNDDANQYEINGTLATSNSHLKFNVCWAFLTSGRFGTIEIECFIKISVAQTTI